MCGPNINEKEERSKKSCMDFNETRVREAGEGAKKKKLQRLMKRE